jgi:hypothetical protein
VIVPLATASLLLFNTDIFNLLRYAIAFDFEDEALPSRSETIHGATEGTFTVMLPLFSLVEEPVVVEQETESSVVAAKAKRVRAASLACLAFALCCIFALP